MNILLDNTDLIILIMELIGTVAFASSGALTAFKQDMDIILDAIGLGIFTVVGVSAGMSSAYSNNIFLLLFLGVITGVGGGVIRDVLAIQKPYILVKHTYACASIAGAIVCVALWQFGDILAMMIGAGTVILIRVLAVKFRWNLPKLQ